MHVGLKVDNIDEAVGFYTRLFASEPTIHEPDYAKWMLDDPRVNFSVDLHGDGPAGSAHYGIQTESPAELEEMRARLDGSGIERQDQNDLVCGYQLQHKSWVHDPGGVAWESFFTEGRSGDSYGCDELPDSH